MQEEQESDDNSPYTRETMCRRNKNQMIIAPTQGDHVQEEQESDDNSPYTRETMCRRNKNQMIIAPTPGRPCAGGTRIR